MERDLTKRKNRMLELMRSNVIILSSPGDTCSR